jgi:hypothetical protein
MTLTEIQEMWLTDCKINHSNLGASSVQVPLLHAKYLNLLTTTKLKLRKCRANLLEFKQLKRRYYRGELSKEELGELGWQQYLFAKPLKSDMDELLEADPAIIAMIDKVEYYETVVYQLESILGSINRRTWDIKNALEWEKFTNGGF